MDPRDASASKNMTLNGPAQTDPYTYMGQFAKEGEMVKICFLFLELWEVDDIGDDRDDDF